MRLRTITCSNGASGSLEHGEPIRTDYSASASLHLLASDEAAARIALGPLGCSAAFARCGSFHAMQLRSNARCSSASNPRSSKRNSHSACQRRGSWHLVVQRSTDWSARSAALLHLPVTAVCTRCTCTRMQHIFCATRPSIQYYSRWHSAPAASALSRC